MKHWSLYLLDWITAVIDLAVYALVAYAVIRLAVSHAFADEAARTDTEGESDD